MNLLKHFSFQKFPLKEIIFNQDDYQNKEYVYFFTMNIRKKYKTKNDQMQNIMINTLYEGEEFRELAKKKYERFN